MQILARARPARLHPDRLRVAGMILALAELLEGTAKPVYQLGASDVNPCTAAALRRARRASTSASTTSGRATGNPLAQRSRRRASSRPSSTPRGSSASGRPRSRSAARGARVAHAQDASRRSRPRRRRSRTVGEREDKIARDPCASSSRSPPRSNGPFDCANTRAAFARAVRRGPARSSRWEPETLDWRDWMMNVHMPAIEKRVIPEMDSEAQAGAEAARAARDARARSSTRWPSATISRSRCSS